MRPSRFSQCALLITINPPPQDLRGKKLSQFRNFHYLTKSDKTPFILTLTSCENF